MSAVWVYVTASDQDEAAYIGQILVEERLVVCANVLGSITAIYWWEGKVERCSEVALVMKTRADLVDAVTEKINNIHSYDCPCVVALPITGGNPDFLHWLGEETQKPKCY